MSELRELYQEVIIDHGRHPRNFGNLPMATHRKEGFNPLCGDKIVLFVEQKNNIVEKIQFEGCGCAISMASASLMTEVLQGKNKETFQPLFAAFHDLVTSGNGNENLGKLAVFGGVREFPARVKCATLAWHTLKALLDNDTNPVCTEK